jgi:hypothetical protein
LHLLPLQQLHLQLSYRKRLLPERSAHLSSGRLEQSPEGVANCTGTVNDGASTLSHAGVLHSLCNYTKSVCGARLL